MHYLIYKTTNLVNGRYYIGAHRTIDINDTYLGSGVALKRAIKKYGKENFTRCIIKECSSNEEMFDEESKIVDFNDPLSYNMRSGGKGGFDHIDTSGDNNPMRNPNTVIKLIQNRRLNNSYHTKAATEARNRATQKAVEVNRGNSRPEFAKIIGTSLRRYHNSLSEEEREQRRLNLSSTFIVYDPEGNQYTTKSLERFCKEKHLPYTTVWKSSITQSPIKKGRAKGWYSVKLN